MKVLMISTVELGKNGIATCILNYSRQLVLNEIFVEIVTPNTVVGEMKSDILSNRIGLHEVTARKVNTLKYFFEVFKIIKQGNYDIVHIHGNSCTMAIELFIAILAGVKTRIAHCHNTKCEHIVVHNLLRPLFTICCNVRFACGIEAGKWIYGKKKFFVIRNGILLEKYYLNTVIRDRVRNKLGIYPNSFLIGHIGTFNYQKNHEFLIDIMKKMPHDYSIVCIGDGENKGEISRLVKEHNLQDRVYFTGNVNNVSDYLQAMDCFILPSRYEGLPYVLIEAQASGLPCIVSNRVSDEVNLSGEICFLPLENSDVWVKEIELKKHTLKNINRNSLCEKNQFKIQESGYDIYENTKQLINLYIKLISKK